MTFSVDSQDFGDFTEVLMELMLRSKHTGWTARTAAQRERKKTAAQGQPTKDVKRAPHSRYDIRRRSPGVRKRSLDT